MLFSITSFFFLSFFLSFFLNEHRRLGYLSKRGDIRALMEMVESVWLVERPLLNEMQCSSCGS